MEILLLAAGLMGLLWLTARWLIPLRELLEALDALSKGPGKPLTFFRGPRPLRQMAAKLETIRERLEEMDRRIQDEGFSLRAILASMEEGVLIVDSNRRIRLANSALIEMFDLQASPINRTVMEVFQNAQLNRTVVETLQENSPKNAIVSVDDISRIAGNTKHFEVSAVTLASESGQEPLGVIAVFHDVTALRGQENARRELVANVSHELRTPLSIIKGYIETLLEGGVEDADLARRFLQTMQKHSERLNYLVEDLMTLSRLESRQADLHFSPINLRESANRVLERLAPTIESSEATVSLEIPDDTPWVEADPDRIDQVFFNLLDNALKYSVGQKPEITVSSQFDGKQVVVLVADNGPGIPLNDQPQIFERFYRIQKDRSRDSGGTGLGLSIVKHIVQAHGGTIGVRNRSPRGTIFSFRLPLQQND